MSSILLSLMLTACSGGEPTPEPTPEPAPEAAPEAPKEAPEVADASDFDAKGKYDTTCAPCHGATGGGDGPAGAALSPKPANFADAAFWAERDDAIVKKAINEGGAAVGKSPIMAPFANSFENDAQVDALIEHMKSFKTE